MARVVLLALLLCGATARASPPPADLRDGRSATVMLDSAVDDAHLENPPGYFPAEPPAARMVERIVIENTGRVPIRNPDVRLNDQPMLPLGDPLAALGLKDATDLPALLTAWRQRRIHATTDLDANRDPLAVLHVLGATFCGDDARALGAITIPHGTEVRFVRLNGHSAAEHRLPGPHADWVLLDGDQNTLYLRWDNRTPASAADLVADPLLALRTKIYGPQATWNAASAWQNASRFEFVAPALPPRMLRLKRRIPARDWELLPGEKIVVHLDRAPERVHGAAEGLRTDPALRGAACLVEFHADAAARDGRVALPFPRVSEKTGEPVYEAATEPGVIACQAARAQFPHLRVGRNEVTWTGRGAIRVAFETRDVSLATPPPPAVAVSAEGPSFGIRAEKANRIWWQIAGDRSFRLIPPNFDQVADFTPVVKASGFPAETFFSPGREYFFRARVRRDGVWSDWCEPAVFTVRKPAQPRIVSLKEAAGGRMRVRWNPGSGEMLVFGSERVDFVPEVYAETEVTRMQAGAIRESRPNRNLLAVMPGSAGEAEVSRRAGYRLIAREGGVLSVPSALVRSKMPARVLQNRHEKSEGALTGLDLAVEMPVPAAEEQPR